MSKTHKNRKIVNSISVGIMAVLSSGTSMLQMAEAADVGEILNTGESLEHDTAAASVNQETVDALDNAGDAINAAQGAVSEAGDIQNGTEIQGELAGSAEAMGELDAAVETLEKANAAAEEAVMDYEYAVEADPYRDGAVENISDAVNEAEHAQSVISTSKDAVDGLYQDNQAAQEELYENRGEAEAAQEEAQKNAETAQGHYETASEAVETAKDALLTAEVPIRKGRRRKHLS